MIHFLAGLLSEMMSIFAFFLEEIDIGFLRWGKCILQLLSINPNAVVFPNAKRLMQYQLKSYFDNKLTWVSIK